METYDARIAIEPESPAEKLRARNLPVGYGTLERTTTPRLCYIDLPRRGGCVAALDFGPADRPIDVVFSHANSLNAYTYRSILAGAARSLRILAYDLRGHGATTLPTVQAGHDWSDLRGDLVELLEVLDVRDVVLSGHSIGATTSLLASAIAAERVRAVALFEPVIEPRETSGDSPAGASAITRSVQGALRRRAQFSSIGAAVQTFLGRGAFKTWPAEIVADYAEGGLRPREDGMYELACSPEWEAWGYQTQPHTREVWDTLERAPRPIRILRGQAWSSTSIGSDQDRLEASGVEIQTVPGAGHFLPMERPDLIAAALQFPDSRAPVVGYYVRAED
jgi:pimeloyl-ACP methyl ester carboxylesterase